MGSRAEIVVIEQGQQRKYYTHWGAESLHLDLLPGPQAALRFATAQEQVERWVYDLEAAAVIDVDNKMLLWFSATCADNAMRSAVFETMLVTWRDWEVHWAGYRDRDLIDYCDGRWPRCMVTLAGAGEKDRLFTPPVELETLLSEGPALLDTIAGWEVANRIPTMLWNGVRLVPAEKTGWLWTFGGSSAALLDIAERWSGWTWQNLDDQVDTSALEAARQPAAGLAEAFTELSESFDQHQLIDKGTESSALLLRAEDWIGRFAEATGLTVTKLQDSAFIHRPIELSQTELTDTREAFVAAALRALP
ncbi:hypothetical protein FEK35_04630 [Nocardia cyriacigeorgica]|uniref:Uncharacterized protein n=1 Tax=Nocardia cyriacigeorgica TaxID=135487 RepID=A0A5R8PIZ1_9NOCA|nr:hypothetical protein [Nocardia cyriacigeorgica]TLG16531.1 hypothetical protein FEK35_04630 [Nocardia cyriacigeorgica]